LSCFIFLFFSAGVLSAQTQEQTVPQSGTEKKVTVHEEAEAEIPAGIPITEISKRAQKAHIALNNIRSNLEPTSDILTIKEQLPRFLYSLKRSQSGWFYKSLNSLNTRKLQDLKQEWDINLKKLDDWENILSGRSRKLGEDNRQLEEMSKLWQLTSESTIAGDAPEVIRNRVRSTLDNINDIRTTYLEIIKKLLTFQDQISEQQLEITKLIGLISEAETQSRKYLFARDSLPLWKGIKAEDANLNFGSQLSESCVSFILINWGYIQANSGHCSLHLIIFIVLLVLMIYFYQRNRRNRLFDEKDEDLKVSAFFISCPFSTALLISMFFTGWIYANAPVAFGELMILLVLIPVLRLAPGIFISELRKPIYVLTGMCLLNVLESIVGDYVLLQRLLLAMITIIAVPLLAWWLRPQSLIYQIKSRLSYTLVLSLSILTLIISLTSLGSNVIGIFPLGHVLVSGMVKILYISIAMYAIAMVLDGFVVLLIRRRSTQALHVLKTYKQQMERKIILFIHLVLIFFWLRMTLRTFGLYQSTWDWFSEIVDNKWTLGAIEISLGAIFSFILILVIAFTLARVVRVILEAEIFSRLKLPRGVPGAISTLVRYTIIGFGLFLAISAIGVNLGKFGLLAGAMGVGLGFGLRNIIENFVSGLIIIFERPIEVGDTIEVGEVFGNVEKIGIRSSTVKTFDGSEVIVPNANLISNQVTNWTMSDRQRRIKLPVKVAFGNDPHKVLELLLKVAREHQGVLDSPEPQAFFNGFGDNYLDFTIYYWLSDNILQTKSEVALGVHDTIKNAGIDTPRPKGDFNLKIIDTPEKKQIVDKGDKIP
jgi:small-conductance mechanosensitive channel